MKTQKIIFVLVILLASLQISFGQEKPEAVLVDEFGVITCEEVMARLDSFFIDLANNPDSTGYIVIYPDKTSTKEGISYERWIKGFSAFRKFVEKRFVIIHGEKRDTTAIEFWRVPPGADVSFYKEEKWVSTFPKANKAFVFASLHIEDVCPTFNPGDYADLLLSDASLRGHIVIFNKSRREAQKEAQEWLTTLTKDYKVPRNRLRVFFAKNRSAPDVEFWIVPKKKK